MHFNSLLLRRKAAHRQIVITGTDFGIVKEALRRLRREYMPFATILYIDGSKQSNEMFSHLPDYGTDKPFSAYICEEYTCKSPVYSIENMLNELGLD